MTSASSGVSINRNGSDEAYIALSGLFQYHHDDVLEIEILPSAIAPPAGQFFIQDGLFVGISKTVLVSAFLIARDVFSRRNQILAERDDYDVRRDVCSFGLV
jgi:hypothetical protein